MPVVIQRIEDLAKIAQLTTGALFYCSQSGNAFNTNPLDMINCINATNTFPTVISLANSGQNLYSLITGFSGELKSSVDWANKLLMNNSGFQSLDYANRILYSSWTLSGPIMSNQDNNTSIESNPRYLWDKSGVRSVLWNDRNLSGNWKLNGTGIANAIQLFQTGSNLQNQINNLTVNAGVSKINGISGNINFTGGGGTIVINSGQTIVISGSNTVSIPSSINFSTSVDWSLANTFYTTLNGVKTISFSNTSDGQSISILITNTNSGLITWPSNVKWPNNIIPAPSSGAADVYTFIKVNTGIYSTVIQNYSS